MKLFIDKIVVKLPKGLCLLIGIPCLLLSLFYMPYTQEELYIEGVISEYAEDVRHVHHVKGADHIIEFYYIVIKGKRIDVPLYEKAHGKFRGRMLISCRRNGDRH